MGRKLFGVLMITTATISFATPSQNLVAAAYAYSSNNTNKLAAIYSVNSMDPVIGYLYAKANLKAGNSDIARSYISTAATSYMTNDLLHQLLVLDYKHDMYNDFKSSYEKLNNTQISTNEQCGYDVANIQLNSDANSVTDLKWLVNNNITDWCADLGLLEYKRHNISKIEFNELMTNLIVYGDSHSFNKLASSSELSHNQILSIQRIVGKAKKHPEDAIRMLNSASISRQDKILLANYIALQFAAGQKFTTAINIFEKYHSNNISNDEFEWRSRSYLAIGKWNKLITSINSMPQSLRDKNVWLYWLAKSYDGIGQYNKATYYLKKIPHDFSYYDLLARGELETPILLDNAIPKDANFDDNKFASEVNNALMLYQIGKDNNAKTLSTIGIFQWYYLTRIATPHQLIAMSLLSRNKGYYDLSISAANKLNRRMLYLSFPTPYLAYYTQFSQQMGISASYALAISRQESRFNATVIAFDGGEGLMQIMPNTAKYISRKSKYSLCSRLNASCNIKYGTWYLGSLYNKFGSYIYASAAYNAGPNRAKRWQGNLSGLDNRIQMEMIPIQITRDYAQKVLVNKAIYDTKLKGSNKLNMLNYVLNLKTTTHNINTLDDDDTDTNKL